MLADGESIESVGPPHYAQPMASSVASGEYGPGAVKLPFPVRLGLCRLVRMPGGHEACFTNPALLAEKIVDAARDRPRPLDGGHRSTPRGPVDGGAARSAEWGRPYGEEGAMPSITVSREVLARIRALREPGEASEDEVLSRVLAAAEADREARLCAYAAAEQDTRSTN